MLVFCSVCLLTEKGRVWSLLPQSWKREGSERLEEGCENKRGRERRCEKQSTLPLAFLCLLWTEKGEELWGWMYAQWGEGIVEKGCGSGPGCHSAVLYKVIPDTESGPKTRAVERLSFLNLYLNLHVCCTKWHRIKAQPEMCCNQKVCESWKYQKLALNVWKDTNHSLI